MSNQFDFTQGPKKIWVDRFTFSSNGALTHLALSSGGDTKVFVFDISFAKKLARGLKEAVDKFESATGQKIDDRLDNDPLPSPMSGDFKKPDEPKKP